ncbi:MAG: hypothetical protein NC453_20420 [Muribaculum sp.]|nr:hypothetical protein [Muribaculum sp.]
MAITLNKQAIRCEEIALAGGKITPASSPRTLLYDISRQWRELLDATSFQSGNLPEWSEREVAASEVLVATLTYLQRIGCKNIEQLLKDTIERHARQNE